jgi:hypothetical protein
MLSTEFKHKVDTEIFPQSRKEKRKSENDRRDKYKVTSGEKVKREQLACLQAEKLVEKESVCSRSMVQPCSLINMLCAKHPNPKNDKRESHNKKRRNMGRERLV